MRCVARTIIVSYQVRIDRLASSCYLRTPVVAGVRADDLGLVAQSYATLHQRLLQLLDLLEVAVFNLSLLKGHSLSEGWSSGEAGGRNSRCIPSGTSTSLAVCHPT